MKCVMMEKKIMDRRTSHSQDEGKDFKFVWRQKLRQQVQMKSCLLMQHNHQHGKKSKDIKSV